MRALLALFLFLLFGTSVLADVRVLPGSSPQTGPVGQPLPHPVEILVLDGGMPVPGAKVSFSPPSISIVYGGVHRLGDNDCVIGDMSRTCHEWADSDGVARFDDLSSTFAGTYEVTFHATDAAGARDLGYEVLSFQFVAISAPMVVSVISGADQVLARGTRSPQPIAIRVATSGGEPVANRFVSGTPRGGGPDFFGLDAMQLQTDSHGLVSAYVFAGWWTGKHELVFEVLDEGAGQWIRASAFITVVSESPEPDNLTNLWWGGPAQNGWGMSIVQHGSRYFAVLFVYDEAGDPTWYVMPSGQATLPNGVGGDLYWPRSAPWFAYDASRFVAGEPVGSVNATLFGPRRANLFADVNESRLFQPVVPQDFTGSGASPMQGLADMWWGGPQQNGWGMAILEQFGNLFMVWFTYREDGKPIWFVMPGGNWTDSSTYAGSIYRTRGAPMFDFGRGYDPSQLAIAAGGRYSIRFQSPDRATLHYEFAGRTGDLDLVRQPFD